MYGAGIMGVGALAADNGSSSAATPFATLSDANFTCSGGGPVTCSAAVVRGGGCTSGAGERWPCKIGGVGRNG